MFTQFNANLLLLNYNTRHEELNISVIISITAGYTARFLPSVRIILSSAFYHFDVNVRPFPDRGRRKAVQIYMLLGVNNNYKK